MDNQTFLEESSVPQNPSELFQEWFNAADKSGVPRPNAMALATSTREGQPSVRKVLLKDTGNDGFVFFTNYNSRKASEIEDNPNVSLVVFWSGLKRQVRVEGKATMVSET